MINDRNRYKAMNQRQLDDAFDDAISKKDLELVKYLATSPELFLHANIHIQHGERLVHSCRLGSLDIVEYLLTSKELPQNIDIHSKGADNNKNDVAFDAACCLGSLSVVEFLTTSPLLKERIKINTNQYNGFKMACYYNKLDVIEFLTTSPKLIDSGIEPINIKKNGLEEILEYCINGDALDTLKFLLTSKKLPENLKPEDDDYRMIQIAANNTPKFLEYLIFEYHLDIEVLLKRKGLLEANPIINNMFKIRDLYEKIDTKLPEKLLKKEMTKKI